MHFLNCGEFFKEITLVYWLVGQPMKALKKLFAMQKTYVKTGSVNAALLFTKEAISGLQLTDIKIKKTLKHSN